MICKREEVYSIWRVVLERGERQGRRKEESRKQDSDCGGSIGYRTSGVDPKYSGETHYAGLIGNQ